MTLKDSIFFLVIDLYFLIPSDTAKIPTGIPTNEANAEIETQPLTAEIKIRKCLKTFFEKMRKYFLCFSPIESLCFISPKR